jgi:hypothetical protein
LERQDHQRLAAGAEKQPQAGPPVYHRQDAHLAMIVMLPHEKENLRSKWE